MKESISTEGLCRFYHEGRPDEIQAIANVDVCIYENQYVLFHGPSGCGKTTLLSLLGCIDSPTKGRVLFHGEDITRFSRAALSQIRRHAMGIVFQSFNLIPKLHAWKNVSLPLIPMGIGERDRFERAKNQMERLGLGERLYHAPEELSGGEQQRVAIARALINDPEIVIADEPTSNIDAISADRLLKILRELKESGKTILVSTHDPVFQGEADITYYLDGGRLRDAGQGTRL